MMIIWKRDSYFPKVPSSDHLRLHLGELTADEARIAKAAYRLALVENNVAIGQPNATTLAAIAESYAIAGRAPEAAVDMRQELPRYLADPNEVEPQ